MATGFCSREGLIAAPCGAGHFSGQASQPFMSDAFHYNVFLSHSTKDKGVVRPVAERLRKDGLKVWFEEWVLKPAQTEEGLNVI